MLLSHLKNIYLKVNDVSKINIDKLIELLEVDFTNIDLLYQALSHSSYTSDKRNGNEENNQRLEFLGDAVLELVISEYLYKTCPSCTEGDLTKLRAAIVCESSLVKAAFKLSLGEFLLLGRGEERSGGRSRPSILADAFEAVLGAIYIDQGFETSKRVILRILSDIIKNVLDGKEHHDYKTELQEIIQKHSKDFLTYEILKEEGPDHAKRFTAGLIYKGKEIGRGYGRSKKEAEQYAAKEALEKFENK